MDNAQYMPSVVFDRSIFENNWRFTLFCSICWLLNLSRPCSGTENNGMWGVGVGGGGGRWGECLSGVQHSICSCYVYLWFDLQVVAKNVACDNWSGLSVFILTLVIVALSPGSSQFFKGACKQERAWYSISHDQCAHSHDQCAHSHDQCAHSRP